MYIYIIYIYTLYIYSQTKLGDRDGIKKKYGNNLEKEKRKS
jgi:hypothetical protein